MPYVEKRPLFDAWQTDGTEANARDIIDKAYGDAYPIRHPDDLIRWKSHGKDSYFTVVVLVKEGNKPTVEWESEPGDYIIRGQDTRLRVMSAEAFHKRFEEVEE